MRLSTLFASTVLATVVASSAAFAAPIVFTWNPAGTSGTALSSAGSQFTADNMTVKDFATINLADPNHVIENGILVVTNLNTVPAAATPGFVNGSGIPGSAQGGATPYQLYFAFSSVSHLAPSGGGTLSGAFDTLTYTLYGDVGGACSFSIAGANCGASGQQLVLATGSLAGGLNSVSINAGGIPAANVNVDILLGPNAGSFFVNPSDLTGFIFETAFTNTGGVVGHPDANTITINGGGGNVDLLGVPEPFTLSLFGAGLAGAAALRRRKAKKA